MTFKRKIPILVLFVLVYSNKKVFFLFIFKQKLQRFSTVKPLNNTHLRVCSNESNIYTYTLKRVIQEA